MDNIEIRPHRAGEASYVSYLQMNYYARVCGFRDVFEHYLLTAMAEFIGSPDGGQLWVAVDGPEIIGSAAIVKMDEDTAQFRWFIVGEGYQGKGVGRRLMDTAMGFCRERGYSRVFLWTVETCGAARRIYKKYGFEITERRPNTEWTGEPLMEERWELSLQ